MGMVKKNQDFWNIATQYVRDLTGKENELIEEFERENLDTLRIVETKEKGLGEMKREGDQLLIYQGMCGDKRAKEGEGCNIKKKYKRFINKQIGETERILSVEQKIKENVTTIVT